ncbi:hypothetical protein RTH46_10475 [Pseudomonas sp. zfem004]|uniref:hypothetical protein n=1 Tax=unclassified Pseudomonas TaxID=196821 RepID=UPI00129A3883|nr:MULTISPECIES: hypothetical protein [unclassified Pseudomonas]MDU9402916.1 hypothetical protein [Pseudomonas sp. zfem004]
MRRLLAPLLLTCFSLQAYAQPIPLLPGEAEYRQALPILDEIDRRMMELVNRREPDGRMNEASRQAFVDYTQQHLPSANRLLEAAIAAGNPAAEYRLAQLLGVLDGQGQRAEICGLFKSSLKRGFTPAALQMRVNCLSDIDTPEYIAQVKALPEMPGPYARYYPQPTILEYCSPARQRPTVVMQLDEPAFRANLYFAMRDVLVDAGAKYKNVKFAYQLKALKYGCPRVQGWLDRQI